MLRALALLSILMLLPGIAQASGLWRCEKNGDVHFEQKALAGYQCKKITPGPSSASPVSSPRKGKIYKRIVNGVAEFSTKPSSGATVAMRYVALPCYACQKGSSVDFSSVSLNVQDYSSDIASLAKQYSIDPSWVRAIIHAESNFNPRAVSPKGAQGLMQLMPATARRFGVSSSFDPAQNLSGGVQYLAWLLKRFHGDHMLATAAYNAGEGAVDRYNGVPPYSETKTYVQRVSTLRSRYAAL